MAKKVNKRKVPNGRPVGKSGKRARPRKEAASPPPTTGGSLPLTSDRNGVPAQAAYDAMGDVITYVYDGQNRLTRVEDGGEIFATFAPDATRVVDRKPRSPRKHANGKTRTESNNSHRKPKTG